MNITDECILTYGIYKQQAALCLNLKNYLFFVELIV